MSKKIVIGIYFHPEAYPPTLNAITELSESFNVIHLLYRPHLKGNWQYPTNVKEHPSGKIISSRKQEQASLFRKITFFFAFTYRMLKLGITVRPTYFLLYDSMSLYAYILTKPFLFHKHRTWYHNHDVTEIEKLRKYSIGWFAAKAEINFFSKLDIFSLPTSERLPYFEINKLQGKVFIIPNYPSVRFYDTFYKRNKISDSVRIIFQGRVGEGHGLETIINTIAQYNCTHWKLVLKGHCDDFYKKNLIEIAKDNGLEQCVEFYGFTEYKLVPEIASQCHIGIAIFGKNDIMNQTLGTASNKVYEYAALGLPVLYLSNSSVANTLKQYNWAFPIMLNSEIIFKTVNTIMNDYMNYSDSAKKSFTEKLNFESQFKLIRDYIAIE